MTLQAFRQTLEQKPINLARAALLFAQGLAYPTLPIDTYERRLDEIAAAAAAEVRGAEPQRAEQLLHFIAQHLGLRGNSEAYNDPRNSFINEVLDRGLGIPVSLSVIYIVVAQRLGLRAYGIGLPGHFIAAVATERTVLLDVFNGERLSAEDCARLVQRTTGYDGAFRKAWLQPAAGRDILLRMLNNLRLIYMQREQWRVAEKVLDHMALVRPERPELQRDRGLVHYASGEFYRAALHFERYLQAHEDAPDKETLQRTAGRALAAWSRFN